MSKNQSYPISKEKLVEGITKCLKNTSQFLELSRYSMEQLDNDSLSLGIYSYALEEFGKSLRLKDYLQNDLESYDIPMWIFGRGRHPEDKNAHSEKITRAIEELGDEFNKVYPGIRILDELKYTETIDLGIDNAQISKPSGTTGTFEDITNEPIPIDFNFRKLYFFIDWDCDLEDWKKRPKAVHTDFDNLISKFSTKINQIQQYVNNL